MKGLKIPKNQSEARKSQDGQHNKMAIRRRTSNDLQNTTQKTKD